MRYLKFVVFSLWIILIQTSCQDDSPILFQMNYEEDFTIPAGLNTYTVHFFGLRDVQSFYATQLQSSGINEDEIISIQAGRARMVNLFNLGNFGGIKDVVIYLVDPNDLSVRKEVFFRENIPQNEGEELQLFGSLVEIKDLASLHEFDIEIELTFKWITQQTQDVRFLFEFVAKA